MAQDIRELLKQDQQESQVKLPEGHRNRFEERLERDLPRQKRPGRSFYFRFAAMLVVALGVGAFFFFQKPLDSTPEIVDQQEEIHEEDSSEAPMSNVTLADISPQFKKIEEYYLANLNLGLSKINITEENEVLIDTFMQQLAELDKEYGRLNRELNIHGPNSETVEALIQNLQLRLDLLSKLKTKLDELKKESNEQYNQTQA